jgi:hypothetical protein
MAPELNCLFAFDGSVSCLRKQDGTNTGKLPDTPENAALIEGA